jgi:hypothetical protein
MAGGKRSRTPAKKRPGRRAQKKGSETSRKLTKEEHLAVQIMQANVSLAACRRIIIQQQSEIATLQAQAMTMSIQITESESSALVKEYGLPERFDIRKEGGDWFVDPPAAPAPVVKLPEPKPDPEPDPESTTPG